MFFRHYAFTHQKIFELTDLTRDNLRPRTPKKMPKTLEKMLEQEEERNGEAGVKEERDPSENVSCTNGEDMFGVVGKDPAEEVSEDDRREGGGGA